MAFGPVAAEPQGLRPPPAPQDDLYACIEESCLRKAREVLRAGDSVKGTDDAAFGKLHALRLCCDVPQMCVDSRGRELYAGSECAACGCESVSLYGCGCTVCPDCTDSLEACPACGGRLGRGVPVEPSVTHHDPTPSSKLQALYKLLTDTPQEVRPPAPPLLGPAPVRG